MNTILNRRFHKIKTRFDTLSKKKYILFYALLRKRLKKKYVLYLFVFEKF